MFEKLAQLAVFESHPTVSVLLAQRVAIVGSQVDDHQAATRAQHPGGFGDRRFRTFGEMQDHAQGRGPETLLKGEIDEARSGDLGFLDIGIGDDQRDQPLGELARRHTSLLGKHHGRVGGKVAMAGILRRLQGDAVEARLSRHDAVMLQLLDDSQDALVEPSENVHAR